jgi:hypothetical protein
MRKFKKIVIRTSLIMSIAGREIWRVDGTNCI